MTVKEKIVIPGDLLAVEEEYSAGLNSFAQDNGNIYASIVGMPIFDQEKRVVSVKKLSGSITNPLNRDSVVYAQVIMVKESAVIVNLISGEKEGKKKTIMNYNAILPISKVSFNYVDDLRDTFKIGDIIKAKVYSASNQMGIELETQELSFGVVKGYCSKCRSEMTRVNNSLKCNQCNNVENRKISIEYDQYS